MNIFFDLDGTLVNSGERLYQLFQHLVPVSKLSYDQYWNLKRNKNGHARILRENFSYTEDSIHSFEKDWMNNIEKSEWISLDQPFNGVKSFIEKLSKESVLYLVTARQSESMVEKQISSFGWGFFFSKILVTGPKREKYDLMSMFELDKTDWLVGDTGYDILTGKKLGISTAAVLSGFLNREKLEEY